MNNTVFSVSLTTIHDSAPMTRVAKGIPNPSPTPLDRIESDINKFLKSSDKTPHPVPEVEPIKLSTIKWDDKPIHVDPSVFKS